MSQKGSRKSRSGCLACKSKRIKCDETKPACITCTSRRHQCPGYRQPLRWSTKYEVSQKNKPRISPFSTDGQVDNWIITEGQGPARPPQRIERPSASSNLSPSKDGSQTFDFLVGGLSPDGRLIEDFMPGSANSPQADKSIDVDVELAHHDFARSDIWSGESHWVDRSSSLSVIPVIEMESFMSMDSTSFSNSTWPVHFSIEEEPFPLEPEDPDDAISRTTSNTSREPKPTSQVVSQTGVRLYHSSTPQTLTHIPTFLIDYWFNTVCSTWNSFDSAKNMNRLVAGETFPHSESLAYSLQSMAAAYLAEHLPHFRDTTITMTQSAVKAIKKELTQTAFSNTFPRHLLLSMFCIGTSACWTDPQQLGLTFLKEIKALLRTFSPSKAALSPDDQNAWVFFSNSCLYWDVMCSIVGAESTGPTVRPMVPSDASSIRVKQDALHPWTGISTEMFMLFSDAISLCRAFRLQMAGNKWPTSQSLRAALRHIDKAEKLHQRIESLHLPEEWEIPDTEDDLTPKSHLVEIAKAYRLAGLAHLRQTFADLSTARAAMETEDASVSHHDDEALGLGLEIVRILEKIPLTSGTRCIQPLLCLTAGIVLKLDVASMEPQSHGLTLNDILSTDLRSVTPPLSSSYDAAGSFQRDIVTPSVEITKRSIEVGQARRFVLERLSILESSLPPKPIRVAKELVRTVWAAYDKQGPNRSQVHWIDIMGESGLRTIFG